MTWTDQQHADAVSAVNKALDRRWADGLAVDDDPRVLESTALENGGNRLHPRTRIPLTGRRLERSLTSGRYDRWATIVWRIRLAETVARSRVRREAFATGDVAHALNVAANLRKGPR